MKTQELDLNELSMVNGGTAFTAGTYETVVHVHDGCGGIINNLFCCDAECAKCHEEHWWMSDFAYHDMTVSQWKEIYGNKN